MKQIDKIKTKSQAQRIGIEGKNVTNLLWKLLNKQLKVLFGVESTSFMEDRKKEQNSEQEVLKLELVSFREAHGHEALLSIDALRGFLTK